MTKIYFKLIMVALALILSVSVVFMSSYAWMVLSESPAVSGIQVAIGGGNTILIAPNVEAEYGDKTFEVPGRFSDKLNFAQYKEYSYLCEVGGLTPVSTVNGIDWFLPAGNSDAEDIGEVVLKSESLGTNFIVDSELSHANLSPESELYANGNYVYLDFWVVSPGGDYTLRISTGDASSEGGSFVMDLPEASSDGKGGFVLEQPEGSAAAAVRIGFLANDLMLIDDTMLAYGKSTFSDNRFRALRGLYQEPDSGTAYFDENRFMIYESNADFHPEDEDLDGKYSVTKALALEGNKIVEKIPENVAIQLSGSWRKNESTGNTVISETFNTAALSGKWSGMEESAVTADFYGSYLQGVLYPYINKGSFIKNSGDLLESAGTSKGVVSSLESATTAGAADDAYIIRLEKNVPQKIRMFIWLEGQDADCVRSTGNVQFAVNIEFAGGTE